MRVTRRINWYSLSSMSKPIIAIVGPSGSGKSTSLRNLDPATTVILDCECKGFPFAGSSKFNIKQIKTVMDFNRELKAALADPAVTLIVIESFTRLAFMIKSMSQQLNKGYDIWTVYAKMVREVLVNCKNDRALIVFTAIDHIVEIPQPDGSSVSKRMIGYEGQELGKQGGIEPDMLLVLFTDVRKDKLGVIQYQFETNNDGVTTAKTPMGLFDGRFIANDLKLVVDAVNTKLT